MSTDLKIRVTVLDMWDEIVLTLAPSTTLATVKGFALEAAKVTDPASEFILKFRGATLPDERRTLAEAGIPNDAGLIALRSRRFAVR